MGIMDFISDFIDYNNSTKQKPLTEAQLRSRSRIAKATRKVDAEIRNEKETDPRKKRIREICIALGEYDY